MAPTTDIRTTAEAHEATALPCARVAHTDPEAAPTIEQEPLPEEVAAVPYADKSPAQWAFERLILYIQKFETQLDGAQEVAIGFTGGAAGLLQIEGIGYFDPDIVTFYGRDENGVRTQAIQHVSQLNVFLRAVPRAEGNGLPRRIGFELARELGAGGG